MLLLRMMMRIWIWPSRWLTYFPKWNKILWEREYIGQIGKERKVVCIHQLAQLNKNSLSHDLTQTYSPPHPTPLYFFLYLSLSFSYSLYLFLISYSFSLSLSLSIYFSISLCRFLTPSISFYVTLSLCIILNRFLSISLSLFVFFFLSLFLSMWLFLSVSFSLDLFHFLSLSFSFYLSFFLSLLLSLFLPPSLSLWLGHTHRPQEWDKSEWESQNRSRDYLHNWSRHCRRITNGDTVGWLSDSTLQPVWPGWVIF